MITSECSPRCGIASGREGHYRCPQDTVSGDNGAGAREPAPLTGTPMCSRWYENAAVRPWIRHLEGCLCGVSAQEPYEHHGAHCPVFRYWSRPQPRSCPECGSLERAEAGYVPGASGQPVTCASGWHDDDARPPGDHAGQAADIITKLTAGA